MTWFPLVDNNDSITERHVSFHVTFIVLYVISSDMLSDVIFLERIPCCL